MFLSAHGVLGSLHGHTTSRLELYDQLACLAAHYPEDCVLLSSPSKMDLRAALESFQSLIKKMELKWKQWGRAGRKQCESKL